MTRENRASSPHPPAALRHLRSNLHWVSVLAVACATPRAAPQAPGSRGPHANEHLDAAREHDEAAQEATLYPDTRADATGRVDQLLVATPRMQDSVADQERAAAAHRSEAQQIYAEYERACGERSTSEVSVSPIVRYGLGGSVIVDGVVLYLSSDAGTAERLLAELACHRAWMRLAPANMDACPLDLDGLLVDAKGSGEGITLTLTVKDKRLVPELQRRAAHDLEMGHSHRH
jgi:hypothetical protein